MNSYAACFHDEESAKVGAGMDGGVVGKLNAWVKTVKKLFGCISLFTAPQPLTRIESIHI